MHILVDMDGTIADWGKQYDADLDNWYWTDFTHTEGIPRTANQKAFNLKEGMTEPQQKIIDEIMDRSGFYAELEPIPGAIQALRDMFEEGHEISIVTSPWLTNPTCITDKYDWVRRHLGEDWVDRVIITKDKTLVDGDILIDDKPEIHGKKSDPTWEHILFDQPYNTHIENGRRLRYWREWGGVIPEPGQVIPELGELFEKPSVFSDEVRTTSATGGQKGQKLAMMSALDPHSIMLIAEVAGFGAQKYDKLNFMKGYDWSLSYDALMRHMNAFWNGEDRDGESGMLHLAHAGWHTLAMLSFYERGLGTDDRYSSMDISKLQTKEVK